MNRLLGFLLLALFILTSAKCPEGTVPSFSDDSKCYLFVQEKQSFLIAEEICNQNNGHLTSIHDMLESTFIRENAQQNFTDSVSSDFWVGLYDLKMPGTWSWIDGTPLDFIDWEKGQPQNEPGYDCGAVKLQGGMWDSDDCDKQKSFVCKITTLSPTTTMAAPNTVAAATTLEPKKCPNSWSFYDSTKSCYKILSNVSWQDAEKACFSEGAHLASIHSLDENNFVTNLIPFNPNDHICDYLNVAWIGLYTLDRQVSWQWIDGSTYNFSAWASNRNGATNTDFCTYIWNGPPCKSTFGTWGDGYCPYQAFAVCKKFL